MIQKIPYGRQDISEDDINEVINVLKSDFLTQGPQVPLFEENVKKYCGADFAVASNSATSSLHSACVALGVSKKDIVWTSAITFVASSNCAIYCGATIDFVDIDIKTFNMCPKKLEEKLEDAKLKNALPKVVIPVHMCGQSCDMKKINDLSKIYGFKIIEDASHAIGGSFKGSKVGSCKFSDVTVFSFHPVKIITSGEGGMALTNDKEIADKMYLHRSHGITRDQSKMKNISDGPWYYEEIDLGFNYRMTDISAALGNNQLKRVDEFISKRHTIAKSYDVSLNKLPLITPFQSADTFSSYHLYVIRIDESRTNTTHKDFFEYLRNEEILVNLHYIPVYRHPYYRENGFEGFFLENAEIYYKTALSIPMYSSLNDSDQNRVIETIEKGLS